MQTGNIIYLPSLSSIKITAEVVLTEESAVLGVSDRDSGDSTMLSLVIRSCIGLELLASLGVNVTDVVINE